jgi:hydrogenase maturation protease
MYAANRTSCLNRAPQQSQHPALCVIGIGNEDRGDDGLGLLVVRALRQRSWPHIQVLESSGEATALLAAWEEASSVIMVDAVVTSAPPGTLYCWNLRAHSLPHNYAPSSSHAFGLPQALELAQALQYLPEKLLLYAIEGACFEPGSPLTPAVEGALPILLHSLEHKLHELLRDKLLRAPRAKALILTHKS